MDATEMTAWPADLQQYYRAQGYWQDKSFSELLHEWAGAHPERIAVISGTDQWSYQQLHMRAQQLAAGFLREGLRAGDNVVVQLPNCGEFLVVLFALFRIGVRPVLALHSHRHAEIGYFAQASSARALIIADQSGGFDCRELARLVSQECPSLKKVIVAGDSAEFLALDDLYDTETAVLSSLSYPAPGSIALFQLSGGSTGLPKLIPRTHNDYIYSLKASVDVCDLDSRSVYLCVLPAAHNFPLSSPGTLGTLYAGGTVVMAANPDPDTCFRLIEQHSVSITGLVPPLAMVWLKAAEDNRTQLSSLQVLQVGGAKFGSEVARQVEPVLGCRLQQVFGMAEGLVNYTRLDDDEAVVVHTQGRPMSAADEILVVDDDDQPLAKGETGHLLTRGPYTIRGYYRAPEHNRKSFTEDGFYRTGDLVCLTEHGNLIVQGRSKDQINRGGEKIAAEEVENHLLAHPGVSDNAIVAMADPYLGERSCAFVVPVGEKPGVLELKRFLKQRGLADFKIPDRFRFLDTLPKTRVGKVSKKELRKLAEA